MSSGIPRHDRIPAVGVQGFAAPKPVFVLLSNVRRHQGSGCPLHAWVRRFHPKIQQAADMAVHSVDSVEFVSEPSVRMLRFQVPLHIGLSKDFFLEFPHKRLLRRPAQHIPIDLIADTRTGVFQKKINLSLKIVFHTFHSFQPSFACQPSFNTSCLLSASCLSMPAVSCPQAFFRLPLISLHNSEKQPFLILIKSGFQEF